jgi:FtsX-like permease family
VTAIGFWQLRLYGAPLTETVHGSLGLDPLLVAAPAIGLLAGAVLALRVVPLLAQGAEAVTRRGRRLVGALGAQQVARRPLRYTRAALLLMLAVSMGVFAISYAETWGGSQQDQADYQIGSDVHVTAPGGAGNVPSWALRAAFAGIDGVRTVMPVDRQSVRLPGTSRQGELIGLDPSVAGDVVRLRDDLTATPLDTLMQPLLEERPSPALVSLEGTPALIRIDARLDLTSVFSVGFDPEVGGFVQTPREPDELTGVPIVGAEVVLRDANGGTHRFTAPPVPFGDNPQQVVIPLDTGSARTDESLAQIGGAFDGPLEVIAIDVTVTLPQSWGTDGGTIELQGMSTSTGEGEPWSEVDLDAGDGWDLWVLRNQGPTTAPSATQVVGRAVTLDGEGEVGAIIGPQTGLRPPAISYAAASLAAFADAPLPVVVNDAFLASTSTRVGDEIIVRLDGLLRRMDVVGTISSFPTESPDRPLMLADLSTLGLIRYASALGTQGATEWWLATEDGQGAAVAEQIDRGPYAQGPVVARDDVARGLATDPVALGIIGALSLGFIVAGLFAAIGLVVSASVSARQRRTEFALLRALGLSSGQLSGWLWLENAAIVAVSLAAGVGLGLLIGWVALPFVTVTQQATTPFPPPIVRTPWLSIGVLVAVAAIALGVTVLILGRVLRHIGIGSVLRMGED